MDGGKVPWPQVREYLLRVGSCQTRKEFMHTACVEVQPLIGFDAAAGVFDASDARVLEGIGVDSAGQASYNYYYRTTQPSFLKNKGRVDFSGILVQHVIDCRKFDCLEFFADFMLPHGLYKALQYSLPHLKITLAIYRSRMSTKFTDVDVDTLGFLNQSLNDLYSSFDTQKGFPDPLPSAESIAKKFRSLSRREAEIYSLVARRLNTTEIATLLFISPRTVEKHIESIFDKLDVRSREQLRWKLGVTPPTAYLAATKADLVRSSGQIARSSR
jgi:Bacterial regulatory proteins, luxR family